MHYYKFNVSSWAKDTGHLSLKEEAIYLRLINYYYDNEKPIPLKTQLVLRKLRMADESETVDLILEEFFTKTKKGWTHHHCDKLINEYQDRAERNRANGKSGGRPKINELDKPSGLIVGSESEPSGNLNYKLLTTNEELITNKDNKDILPVGDVPPKKAKSKKIELDESRIVELWNSLGCVRHNMITKVARASIEKSYKEYCKAMKQADKDPLDATEWILGYLQNGFAKWMTDHHRQLNDGQWAADLEFAMRPTTYEKVKSTVVTKRTEANQQVGHDKQIKRSSLDDEIRELMELNL